MQDLNIIYIQYSIQFYIRLEKKYAPALDNYGQSCFVRKHCMMGNNFNSIVSLVCIKKETSCISHYFLFSVQLKN
jgi:predicted alpha/beta superfamily hydrolase